ncbi:SHOCT domain-containing protein [Rhizobium sp. ARZ01]|uniref:SHOCT domain-containing protein n=1 Tax=Rhizobium sp. ARZ01 TaxID=2769313 RepID=UPI00178300D3|nr:SHOCT domain-containing protein [Rhizobium sp. ARZ01]MBD9372243.1 SHOCT domain-containing protein [Rhizobium sp. ARZ01]
MALDFRQVGAAVVLGGMVVLGGCAATSSQQASVVNAGADRSATYPDITARVYAATTQMSNEEAASISARMNGLASQRRAGAISEAEYRKQMLELQTLAESHGADTLKEIEN